MLSLENFSFPYIRREKQIEGRITMKLSPRPIRTSSLLVLFFITHLLPFLCTSSLFFLSAFDDVALIRTNFIWNMDRGTGLTYEELLSACRYIEKIRQSGKRKVFSSRRTKLPCVIERIVSPKGFLIRACNNRHTRIGYGAHKVVHKAIFYSENPKIVADCSSDESGAVEIAVFKRLRKCPGIVPFLGSVESSKGRYSIFLEYFSGGTLGGLLRRQQKLSTDQMLQVAKDVAQGLKCMHERHLIHRDLHLGNILLRSTHSGRLEAALVDFGKTLNADHVRDNVVLQASKGRNPPEALLVPFSKINRYLADVYAMGCNYYCMKWQQPVPWQQSFNVYALHTYTSSFRKKIHARIVTTYKREKREKTRSLIRKKRNGESLSPDEEFQMLIFQMIDFEPSRRPCMSEVVRRLARVSS
jgi:serine/threonine protein kinase